MLSRQYTLTSSCPVSLFCLLNPSDLRPVEEFRHTPIVPISEKDLIKHQESIAQKNRQGYYVEVKKDTIYFYTIALLSLGIVFYTFMMVNENSLQIM